MRNKNYLKKKKKKKNRSLLAALSLRLDRHMSSVPNLSFVHGLCNISVNFQNSDQDNDRHEDYRLKSQPYKPNLNLQ